MTVARQVYAKNRWVDGLPMKHSYPKPAFDIVTHCVHTVINECGFQEKLVFEYLWWTWLLTKVVASNFCTQLFF